MVVTKDPASSANFTDITIEHIHIEWTVNFVEQLLDGSAELTAIALNDNVDHINLDVRNLQLETVQINNNTIDDYSIVPQGKVPNFGQTMRISLPKNSPKGQKYKIFFKYKTSENATALQWLTKEQTGDRLQPQVFTYSQEINSRSILPCMDTPSVKQTYTAKISVPNDTVALMSGIAVGLPYPDTKTTNHTVYEYRQNIPIPTYLIALSAGRYESHDISDRCRVWAEPSMIGRAAYELAKTEEMLQTAIEIAGPYVWERCDFLILPPSFPLGGMENTNLIYLTPTMIIGDRSATRLVAHEMSHSWTGNLVTNATWEHFWLNEGFTTFLERKITEKLYGEQMRDFVALNAWTAILKPAVVTQKLLLFYRLLSQIFEQFNPDHPLTALVQDHTDIDPKEAFSTVYYEKGYTFLSYLEKKFGKNDFADYIRAYIQHFARKSLDTDQWKEHFIEYFTNKSANSTNILKSIDFDRWLFSTGMPVETPNFDTTLAQKCIDLCKCWIDADEHTLASIPIEEFRLFSPLQQMEFITLLCESSQPLPTYKLEKLNDLYQLNKSKSYEILHKWIRVAIRSKWQPIIPIALEYITNIGRLKFIRPIYRDLIDWDETKLQAEQLFRTNRPFMHPVTAFIIGKEIEIVD